MEQFKSMQATAPESGKGAFERDIKKLELESRQKEATVRYMEKKMEELAGSAAITQSEIDSLDALVARIDKVLSSWTDGAQILG